MNQTPITRLLVANRGEIARRIMRTAHKMGVGSVAIYADDDAQEPFVREADQAFSLDGRSSAETYLDVSKVLEVARRSGADAVHPGYGFLAENSGFARAVIDAGLVWVGPSPEAIDAMGDKLSAKRLMQKAKVPTLPAAEVGSEDDVAEAAARIGYPLLVKASAGGGGKGMRVVASLRRISRVRSTVLGAKRRHPSETTRSSSSAGSKSRDMSRSRSSATSTARCSTALSANARSRDGIRRSSKKHPRRYSILSFAKAWEMPP